MLHKLQTRTQNKKQLSTAAVLVFLSPSFWIWNIFENVDWWPQNRREFYTRKHKQKKQENLRSGCSILAKFWIRLATSLDATCYGGNCALRGTGITLDRVKNLQVLRYTNTSHDFLLDKNAWSSRNYKHAVFVSIKTSFATNKNVRIMCFL